MFEFRDASWFDEEIQAIFKQTGAVYCRADRRAFYAFVSIPDTADFIYVRRHGDPVRNGYTDKSLRADAEAVEAWLRKRKQVFVCFNNDGGGAALKDAKRLERLILEGGARGHARAA